MLRGMNPELMSRGDTALLVIDVQEKMMPHIRDRGRVVWNVRRLIDGAKILGLPVEACEQYPEGLGKTVPELAERLGEPAAKLTFSCSGCPELFAQALRRRRLPAVALRRGNARLRAANGAGHDGRRLAGLRRRGRGGLAVRIDHRTALARMDSAGATLTTTESALFELCRAAGTPEFKQISRLAGDAGHNETAEKRIWRRRDGHALGPRSRRGHAPVRRPASRRDHKCGVSSWATTSMSS